MIPHLQTQTEFFQIIDKFEREPENVINDRLKRLNTSFADVRDFIETTKEKLSSGKVDASNASLKRVDNLYRDLEARKLAQFVDIDLTIVRGLAYYNGTVFEVFSRGEKRASNCRGRALRWSFADSVRGKLHRRWIRHGGCCPREFY